MRAVIFVNGVIPGLSTVQRCVKAGDDVLAADGGAHHAVAMGLRPRVVVGDMDSVSPELVAQLEAEGVEFERHPAAKNKTDLELTIERAIGDGAEEIVLLGALGGRLDQSLANVLLLAQQDWPVPIHVVDANEIATVIHGGEAMTLEVAPGSTVSLLPLSATVTGITYTGMLYPLHDATLTLGSTRGVSNEVVSHPATVRIAAGIALVIQSFQQINPTQSNSIQSNKEV